MGHAEKGHHLKFNSYLQSQVSSHDNSYRHILVAKSKWVLFAHNPQFIIFVSKSNPDFEFMSWQK